MKSNDTLHAHLVEALMEEIRHLRPGDRIPSERQLCDIFHVSRTTVRNAINTLELRGRVKRLQGKGTFVVQAEDELQNLSNYYSFTEATRKQGKVPTTLILEYHIHEIGESRARMMRSTADTQVIEILRLRLADGVPMMLEHSFIPYEPFPDITKSLLEKMPLYEIYEKKYGRKIFQVNEQFSASQLNAQEAAKLEEKDGQPCLMIHRHSYDRTGRLIEYTESVARREKFVYATTYFPK